MTSKRKLVRRSFLAAVSGAGALTLAACSSDPGHNNSAENKAAPAAAPASDSDSG